MDAWMLACDGNQLTKLDVSKNTAITVLHCNGNVIIDLKLNDNLQYAKDTFIPEKSDADAEEQYVCYAGVLSDDIEVVLYVDPVKNGWIMSGTSWYYFTDDVYATAWKKIGGKWYYFNTSGVMQTGWQKVRGKWYYFAGSGAMQTGWKTISGKTYFFKEDGSMAANEWCRGYWLNANGTWTYKYKASWKKSAKGWWFGDTSGWFAKSDWQLIDSKWYYFDTKGYIVTGTQTINGKVYKFNSSGACLNP